MTVLKNMFTKDLLKRFYYLKKIEIKKKLICGLSRCRLTFRNLN